MDLDSLVARVPLGWSEVWYAGRSYGLTRTDHVGGRSESLYAEALGDVDVVSANVFRLSHGSVLKPCEMSAETVVDFLVGWTSAPTAHAEDASVSGDDRPLLHPVGGHRTPPVVTSRPRTGVACVAARTVCDGSAMTGGGTCGRRAGSRARMRHRSVMDTALPSGPFTRADARTAGVSPDVLRGPGVVRLFHGVYVATCATVTLEVTALAALRCAPKGSRVARHTAARLWGGVVPDSPDLHLLIPAGERCRVQGIDARVSSSLDGLTRAGLPVTTPARTFVDLAEDLTLLDLVVLGDSLVRRSVVTPGQLVQVAASSHSRGARLARRAASLVRERVDSPMETRLRLLLVLAGLPEPVINLTLRTDEGETVCRLDLSYPQWKLAVEYDGRQHAESTAQWTKDLSRREWLDGRGWRVVVVTSTDVYRTPSATLARVVDAARARGARMRVTSQEWRRHFPDRVVA